MAGSARWFRRALLALVLLGGAAFAWSWLGCRPAHTPDPTAPSFDDQAFRDRTLLPDPVELAPGLYALAQTNPSEVYAVDTSEGLVLIDTGREADASKVLELLKVLHLDVTRLRAILLTHVHGDHTGGAQYLHNSTGARIYAGRGDCQPLRDGGPREAFYSTYPVPDSFAPQPTTVDVELTGDEVLQFGDARFTAIATPGHTPGSICYLMERQELRAMFTGDVVQHLNPARAGFLGTYSAYQAPRYLGNARDMLASLRKLRKLPAPDLALPGHPRMDRSPETPRISAARWYEMLDKGIAEMELLVSRYDTDGANFLDGHPRELWHGLHYRGECAGSAVYTVDTPKGLLLFDAPGGLALLPLLGGRKPAAVLLTSTDKEATAGLADLVRGSGCQVIAPRAGLEPVRSLCPKGTAIRAAEDLGKDDGLDDLRVIPLHGRGRTPIAYVFRWAGKEVLVSGRIPVKLNHESEPQLLRDLTSAEEYAASLRKLEEIRPALWLPAITIEGQNANLYDDKWETLLEQNRKALP